MKTFTRSIIACTCILFFIGYAAALVGLLISFFQNIEDYNILFFIFGFLLFSALWVCFGARIMFLRVFFHELAHAIFQVLTGHKPQRMFVSDNEGGFITGTGGNVLIYLSPYFFPSTAIVWLLIFNIIRPAFYEAFFFILGTLTSFHMLSSAADYLSQFKGSEVTDINQVGKVFATILIIFINIVIYGAILAFTCHGFSGIVSFLASGYQITMSCLQIII